MKVNFMEVASRINAGIERERPATQPRASDEQEAFDSVRVSLSALGRSKSASAQAEKELEESSLPGDVKVILKMIRELKIKIAEAMMRMSEAMADDGQTPSERLLRIESIQIEINTLQGALNSASAALVDAIKQHGLSDQELSDAMRFIQI